MCGAASHRDFRFSFFFCTWFSIVGCSVGPGAWAVCLAGGARRSPPLTTSTSRISLDT